jgi:hypothetical protein
VGQWGGLLLEDEIQMVGKDVEAEIFHWRGRFFLENCLRTTPEIRSRNGQGIPKPNLKSASQLLKLIMEETNKVNFLNVNKLGFEVNVKISKVVFNFDWITVF